MAPNVSATVRVGTENSDGSTHAVRRVENPNSVRSAVAIAALAAASLYSASAWAHGADPAVAYINEPVGVGNVVDDEFFFTWVDADRSIPTGTATVDFYYTDRQAPTFLNGERHPDLTGTPIVLGIIEKEMPNEYTWDLTNVPSGSYLLWSEVIEPPEENMAVKIIEFSPGILTVAHPGDPVHPAVMLRTPTSPFQYSDDFIELMYSAFDPDGTGRVMLEARAYPNGEDYMLIADDLPADEEGSYGWDTSELDEGDWILRATITDDRGLSHYHYARYFLLVTHPPPIRPDAGVIDAGKDAGSTPPPRDAGVGATEPPSEDGCSCTSAKRASSGFEMIAILLLFGVVTRRR